MFAGAVSASWLEGSTGRLPDIALQWPILFHLERAALLVGVTGVALLTGWRAARGEFPISFGNLFAYERQREIADESRLSLHALKARIDVIEQAAFDRLVEEADRE